MVNHPMKQTDSHDVPDDLWERIEPFLARSSENEVMLQTAFTA